MGKVWGGRPRTHSEEETRMGRGACSHTRRPGEQYPPKSPLTGSFSGALVISAARVMAQQHQAVCFGGV